METWLRKRLNDKQREAFERDMSMTPAPLGAVAAGTGWGESADAVASQDRLGASTPTFGPID